MVVVFVKVKTRPTQRESTHTNVRSCPYNQKIIQIIDV